MPVGARKRARLLDSPEEVLDYQGRAAAEAVSRTTRERTPPSGSMELLVCIINREEHLDAVLSGFLNLGVSGATVVSSEGMAHLIDGDIPVLAGLQTVLAGGRPQNAMVFSLIESEELLERAIAMIREETGDLDDPATGLLFTLPVGRVVGLASRNPMPSPKPEEDG